MKRILAMVLSVLAVSVFLLAGCGGKEDSSYYGPVEITSEAAEEGRSIIENAPGSQVEAPSVPESYNEDDLNTFLGVIDDVAMSKYYIRNEEGVVYMVRFEDVDHSELTETMPGSEVLVYYLGDMDGGGDIVIVKLVTP